MPALVSLALNFVGAISLRWRDQLSFYHSKTQERNEELMMKRALQMALMGATLAPWMVCQAITLNDDFSLDLTVGAYSDYHSRGMSQTQGDPAIQGSARLSHSSGLYAGIWSSNVDYGYDSKTRQEIDYYVGYFWQATDDISLDLTYYQYEYPKEGALNNSETYAKLTAYGAYVGGYYSNDLYGDQSYFYSFVGYETTLPMEVGLDLRYGKVDFKDDTFFSRDEKARSSYNEWQVTLSKTLFTADWSLSYADSDLSDSECYSYNGFDDVCAPTVIAGVSKSF